MQYIDPRMPKRIDRWRSPALGLEMPIVTYGFAGQPVLLFPTAAADFLSTRITDLEGSERGLRESRAHAAQCARTRARYADDAARWALRRCEEMTMLARHGGTPPMSV